MDELPAKKNPLDNLVNFKKGYDPRRHLKGRAKKYETTLSEKGYAKSEMVDAINILISLDEAALIEVSVDEHSTVLEKIISLALLESIRRKTLWNIETLLNRVYGQPKQEIEQEIKGDIKITFKLDDNKLPPTDITIPINPIQLDPPA